MLILPNLEHGMFFHLFVYSLILLSSMQFWNSCAGDPWCFFAQQSPGLWAVKIRLEMRWSLTLCIFTGNCNPELFLFGHPLFIYLFIYWRQSLTLSPRLAWSWLTAISTSWVHVINSPASASQVAGTTGMCHPARPEICLFNLKHSLCRPGWSAVEW